MSERNCKILVCCHKKDLMATEKPYMPIHVGKALHPDLNLGIIGDDTGDNMSLKNGSYCELTGMYWAWKNLKDVDVIGLCHYRRYFDFHRQTQHIYSIQAFSTDDFYKMDLSIPDKVIDGLKNGEAIVAKYLRYMFPLMVDYCKCHISDDFRILENVIKEKFPEYYDSFVDIMYRNNLLIPYNMFIMTWQNFDEYCSWIFEVLREVESRTDISHYDPIQSRIYGYMAERLFNVWLHSKKFKLIQKPVMWFNRSQPMNLRPLTLWQRNIRAALAMFITKPRK